MISTILALVSALFGSTSAGTSSSPIAAGGQALLKAVLPSGLALGVIACVLCAGGGYWLGYRYAYTWGSAELEKLKETHAEQSRQAAEANGLQLQQQVTRANQAEQLLLNDHDLHAQEGQPIEERIPDVVTVYRPAQAVAPEPIPRCVFTVGWLRDYNTALGVPGAAVGPVTGPAGTAPWAAPGTDAELLESGVTPADILAHAKDYGIWAKDLASQVKALHAAQGAQ